MIASPTVRAEIKQLLRQSSHYLVGLLGGLALGFVSFPIFTRAFSVADYGLIDYAQKIMLLLTALCKAGMQNSALRFYDRARFSQEEGAAGSYYATMYYGVAGSASVATLLVTVLLLLAPRGMVDDRLAVVLAFTPGLILLRALQSMLWSFMRIEERTRAYNITGLLMKAASIAVICLLLPVLGASARTYFVGTLLVESLIVVFITWPLWRKGLLKLTAFDPTLLKAALAFGLPMISQEVAAIVLDSGDRVVVRHFLGDEPLGLYSVAYGLAGYVNTLLAVPLGLAVLPIYMRLWRSEGRAKTVEFLSLGLDGFLMAAGLLMALAACLSRDTVLLLASAKYRGADALIPTLVAGLLISTAQVFLNAGLLIHRRTVRMASILGLSAVLNLLLNWVLVPRMGIQAAALATLVSYLFYTAWLARDSFRLLSLDVSWRAPLRYTLAAVAAAGAAALVTFDSPLANLAVKGTLACIVYAAVLFGLDRRVRGWVAALRSPRDLEACDAGRKPVSEEVSK